MHGGTEQNSGDESKHAEEQDSQNPNLDWPSATCFQRATKKPEPPASEDDIVSNISEPTPVPIPYRDGFGDFYFGSMESWERKSITETMSEEEKSELMGLTDSNGVPVAELNGFQRYVNGFTFGGMGSKLMLTGFPRSGPFPYNKLPVEIREKIIRILLQPVFCTYHNGSTLVKYTVFSPTFLRDPFDHLNYGNEDLYYYSEKAAHKNTSKCAILAETVDTF
jgi:hypothetical protein